MVNKDRIFTFKELDVLMGNKNSIKLINNTSAVRISEDKIAIRLHETDIITITKENNYILKTGGWYTKTTLERLNRLSPATIKQVKGKWLVRVDQCGLKGWMPFSESMTVDEWGEPISPNPFEKLLHSFVVTH